MAFVAQCGKRHSDVKRDIEVLTEQLDVDVSKFAHIYLDSMNRQQTEYHGGKSARGMGFN